MIKPHVGRWFDLRYGKLWWWRNLHQIWFWFTQCIHRGLHGWAPEDIWNFDGYLLNVFVDGLKYKKRTQCGYPSSLTKEEWDAILDIMIEGFEAAKNMDEWDIAYDAVKYENSKRKFNHAMRLFHEYFFALWD